MFNNKSNNVAVYIRKNKNDLIDIEKQKEELFEYAQIRGFEIKGIYIDQCSSNEENKPRLNELIQDLGIKNIDTILVNEVATISRESRKVLEFIDDTLHPANVRLHVKAAQIDSSTPNGYMFLSMFGTFQEYMKQVQP